MAGHNYLSDPKNPFFSLENDIDDETFIKSAPRRPAVSPVYSSYNSSNHSNMNNELEQKHYELVSKKKEIEDRTIKSSERSISLLRDSEEIGAATAEELIRQREQLERTEKRLDDINTTLRFSQKHIQGIKSVFGSLKNYLSGKSIDVPASSVACAIPESYSAQAISSSANLTNSLEQTRNHLMEGEHPSFRLRGLSEEESVNKSMTNNISTALEKNLDEMSGSLARLKGLAIGLSEEIDSQNDLIDNIDDKTDKADIMLKKQNKDMKHLLKK
ncbi:synaptosomal-associated protein 29 [Leptopilina heterotoma]|uniref:synaptosomal-associated protein 29 n=1 Tax=Leptopilina heterotoma TaxID=63436 RepID=UPI001CA7E93E|nr:synaptosomal-associated protein 29 [Leptopilina heterotoma]